MKKLATKTACLLFVFAAALSSCKKDHDGVGPTKGTNNGGSSSGSTAKYLKVALNEYMPVSKIDSAVAIWEVNGVKQTEKMALLNDQLRLPLASFNNNGSGVLSIQLFSQEKVDNKPLQWEYQTVYTLEPTQEVNVSAPIGMEDPTWKPRATFHYNSGMGSRFSVLVALRPEDAFFELKGVEPIYAKRIEIVRSFHQRATGVLVFSRGWVGDNSNLGNKGNLVDRLHFLNLREQIGEKDWSQYRIRASFYLNSNPSMVYEFNLERDRL